MTNSKVIWICAVAAGLLSCAGTGLCAEPTQATIASIAPEQGICVLLGESAGTVAIDLARKTKLLIYVQLPQAEQAAKLRRQIDAAGFYGTRVFVECGPMSQLYLADNIADAVIVFGGCEQSCEAELLRVVRPGGKVHVGQKTIVKPFPAGIDDWSHPYHGPDNNPQSQDRVVVAPYLTQFLAEPRYGPLPQVAVASAGRVFKAFGHVAFKRREEPLLNKLVAFNGYNGTILWQRDLPEGYMIHRNTIIAMPDALYVGDDRSCKIIDPATGRLIDEIAPPVELAGGTFWKWMGLEDGILVALLGEEEQRDPTKRWRRDKHGWPWYPISTGFNQPENPWGFGRNVLGIDVRTKKVLWRHHERQPIDSRAMCMKNGRIYIFRFGTYLAALDARTGKVLWRKTPDNAPELFASLGRYLNRQDWRTNWRTTAYLKCSDKALYFAGPPIGKLLVVSTEDGRILWENSYSNFQLVLRGGEVYGISGQIDNHPSVKFAALTGQVLGTIDKARRACTRPTGSADAIFFRAQGGSVRLDLATDRPQWISPMRPNCHDGVTIANGLLYWWPSVCDCQLTLYGVTCLGPAGDFDFMPVATESERLEKGPGYGKPVEPLELTDADWPTFRADNRCSGTSKATVTEKGSLLWSYQMRMQPAPGAPLPTAPTAAADLVFVAGPDGIVRALDGASGKLRWKAYTGGAVQIAPTIWRGRVFVGSGDGWVYAFEARSGRLLWRFRSAPIERRIPVYGSLLSTWPAASGVLVQDGTAYVAAGIVNYDGTYVYALDAQTGRIKWHNNSSGHLDRQGRTGVSVQGHLLLHDGKLYLAGGTSISPAIYDITDGRCLNDPKPLADCIARSPRGWELTLIGKRVFACGKPYYAHPAYDVYDNTVFNKMFLMPAADCDVIWLSSQYRSTIMCTARIDRSWLREKTSTIPDGFLPNFGKLGLEPKRLWQYDDPAIKAVAVCSNAVVAATNRKVMVLRLKDGTQLWSAALPAEPVPWGLVVDRHGRVIVSCRNGQVLCFGAGSWAKEAGSDGAAL